MLTERPEWRGECWDRDPLAVARIESRAREQKMIERMRFEKKTFSLAPTESGVRYATILADIGVSSFQLDDPERGMSLHSQVPPDFRMDPKSGVPFRDWLSTVSESRLAEIFEDFGEEPRAKKIAREMKSWGSDAFLTASELADRVTRVLGYESKSRVHPATRVFQALRVAINDEIGQLQAFLDWAPRFLEPGGRLMVISFHSIEDRIVKNRFRDLATKEDFDILTKKPLMALEDEVASNPRSRSAKLRVLQKKL